MISTEESKAGTDRVMLHSHTFQRGKSKMFFPTENIPSLLLDESSLLQLATIHRPRNFCTFFKGDNFHSILQLLRMLSLRAKSILGHYSNVVSFVLNPAFKKILATVHWCLTYHIISRFTVLEEAEQY